MEQSLGSDSGPADKSRVLNVKPLRCLVPIFPSPPNFSPFSPGQSAPFVCANPSGPFPSGFAPFYPFFSPTDSQRPPEQNSQTPFGADDNEYSETPNQNAQYLSSFSMHVTDAERTSKAQRSKSKSQKRGRKGQEVNFSSPEVDVELIIIGYILMVYDLLRRRITQIEDGKEATPGVTRRPDLRSGTILMNKGIRTNIKKRIGLVPGVEVGDIFFFRMEMCLVGLHAPCMAGIDYMGYEDNVEDGDVLIYSGQAGVILPDLTSGAENLPVSLVNDVDDEKGPAYFTYFPSLRYSKPVNLTEPSFSCNCQGGCLPGNSNCSCIKKNGGYIPYNVAGVLVNNKSLIYECGPCCSCPINCRNRISQAGLKVRLEVFKTKDKGWGLRSWDPIRAGAFICEYAGEVINDSRFMNHSCSPNVFWQPVLRESNSESYLHIAFFAIRHIPPMTELTYDYGITQSGKADERKKRCLCGSLKCRGHFY
ncbi:unnamed protein product, partial [Vitis vinifera]